MPLELEGENRDKYKAALARMLEHFQSIEADARAMASELMEAALGDALDAYFEGRWSRDVMESARWIEESLALIRKEYREARAIEGLDETGSAVGASKN